MDEFGASFISPENETLAVGQHQLKFQGNNKSCRNFDNGENAINCQASVLKFSSTAEVPFEQGFSVYGRLGLQYLQKNNAGDIDLLRLNINDLGAVFGFGLKYKIKKDWYLSAESEGFGDLDLNFMGIGGSSMHLFEPKHSIGLSVRF